MKPKPSSGFAALTLIAVILAAAAIVLAAIGIMQNNSSKSHFSTAVKTPATTKPSHANTTQAVSASDKAKATNNLLTINTTLEAYFAAFNYYPGTINADEFTSLASSPDYSGSNPVTTIQQATTAPSDVVYKYTPSPAGCSTAAKTCQHFSLTASDKTGQVIGQQQDLGS